MADDTTADVLAIDAAVLRSTDAPEYGITTRGFVPKPFARLLAEKLALARELFGQDLDLTAGSLIRKLLEVSALEESRTWAALGSMYDNAFVVSATGEALSRLGEELGVPRPYLEATGTVTLRVAAPPSSDLTFVIPRGTRMLTPAGDDVATAGQVVLSVGDRERDVAVSAVQPGPDGNIDPRTAAPDGSFPHRIDRWNLLDPRVTGSGIVAADGAGQQTTLVTITHDQRLQGGEQRWPDTRYRELLLRAPRSVWTSDALTFAVSFVPGVRQVKLLDAPGGLDVRGSLEGTGSFVQRLFADHPTAGSPFGFTLLIAPTPAAIWDGPSGLAAAIQAAVADLRPMGIYPRVEQGQSLAVGIRADIYCPGLAATGQVGLKQRLMERVRRYIDSLEFGDDVRSAEVTWAIMSEPSVLDSQNLSLLTYPPLLTDSGLASASVDASQPTVHPPGKNVTPAGNEVPVFVDDASGLTLHTDPQ
jgi:Baseplate J-like protein